jgi:hypothetical protein
MPGIAFGPSFYRLDFCDGLAYLVVWFPLATNFRKLADFGLLRERPIIAFAYASRARRSTRYWKPVRERPGGKRNAFPQKSGRNHCLISGLRCGKPFLRGRQELCLDRRGKHLFCEFAGSALQLALLGCEREINRHHTVLRPGCRPFTNGYPSLRRTSWTAAPNSLAWSEPDQLACGGRARRNSRGAKSWRRLNRRLKCEMSRKPAAKAISAMVL